MTTVFRERDFERFFDRDWGRTYSDFEFHHCRFRNCNVSLTMNPHKRSRVHSIKLVGCEVQSCLLGAAIVEEVLVDGLKTTDLFRAHGAAFRHVSFEGNLGRIMINSTVLPGQLTEPEQHTFDEANTAFYATVDWALDIRNARFLECDLRGIPARLVVRDPATQVVVKRDKVLEGHWRRLDLSRTYWATALEMFLSRGQEDVVLVAPKRERRFRLLLDGLMQLREIGVAEPD